MASIGIIGAGNIGRAIATALARRGIPATIANRRGPRSLEEITASLGPTIVAGTREEAAAKDIVFVAVNWSKLPDALGGLPDFAGRIVVDANNPIEAPRFERIDLGARTSSEVFAKLAPGARVVKAFNHLTPDLLVADPTREGGRRVLFVAGDDEAAKAEVGSLGERLGFTPIDVGSLVDGGKTMQFPGGALPGRDLVQFAPKSPEAPAAADFDAILKANLERVFSERDGALRTAAVAELFVEQPVMYEPDAVVTGRKAIADVAGKLLEKLGPTFRFVPDGAGVGHHGVGTLRWHGGPAGGPVTVTGFDTAEIVGGRIARLWVLLG